MNGVRCEQGPSRAPPAAGTSVGTVPCAGCRPSCGQGCPLPEPQRSRRCAEIAAGAARPLLQQEAPRAAAHPAQGWDSVPRPPKLRAERCSERWLYPYVGGSSERDMAAGPPLGRAGRRAPAHSSWPLSLQPCGTSPVPTSITSHWRLGRRCTSCRRPRVRGPGWAGAELHSAGGCLAPSLAHGELLPSLAGWYRGYSLRNRAARVGEGHGGAQPAPAVWVPAGDAEGTGTPAGRSLLGKPPARAHRHR